jgi:SET domain-containing protein
MLFIGKINFPLTTAKSKIDGTGAYAKNYIPARKKIGSLSGEIITKKEARRRTESGGALAMVELWNGKAIDATKHSTGLRYINHSCDPNTYMRTFNYHVEFYALKKIAAGEELTCNYGETHHNGKRVCKCGAANCKGFI